ncbi:3-oxoacyl-ACP reductase [Corynebacterium breve]|uniref:3-oxoacyl-ACP reductase n=1 Tax=Corynebacterium breve TaxID=3049799 RepID=A0ABY8VFB6_9CORY|nr:3-oxoacyl-ACP reductase [Corynebacterium breve]WIM67656.1 3-oxoacyl-ACP reductase [Corynebacterium breve]
MNILESILTSGPGRLATKQLGLKEPPKLRRGDVLPAGKIVLAAGSSTLAQRTLQHVGLSGIAPLLDDPSTRTVDDKGKQRVISYDNNPGAIVIDATDMTRLDDLEKIRAVLRPGMRDLEKSGRVILVGPHPADAVDHEARAVAEALDGLMRTVAKELRAGSTANLIRVRPDVAPVDLASTMNFLISGRSAFVSGQTWVVGPAAVDIADESRPFEDRVVVVTGAARGIGEAIARTFAHDGATVVVVDLPAAGESLARVAVEIGGSALQLDITSPGAAATITKHIRSVHGDGANLWAIIHNAGITRDKMLANLDEVMWKQVIDINLKAEMAINEDLLTGDLAGGFNGGGRIIGVSSTSGIAGNKGQTNYAASKAGVIGYTESLADELAGHGITANAVAPGFIETDMTAEIPYINREIFRRVNSLSQGGRPVDVAETIAYLARPASGGVTGQTIRVCGQNLVGK